MEWIKILKLKKMGIHMDATLYCNAINNLYEQPQLKKKRNKSIKIMLYFNNFLNYSNAIQIKIKFHCYNLKDFSKLDVQLTKETYCPRL